MRKFSSLVNLVEDEICSTIAFDSRVDSIILEAFDENKKTAMEGGINALRNVHGDINSTTTITGETGSETLSFKDALVKAMSNAQTTDGGRVYSDDNAINNVYETFVELRNIGDSNFKQAIQNILFDAKNKFVWQNVKYIYDQCISSGGKITDQFILKKFLAIATKPGEKLNGGGTAPPVTVLEQIRSGTEPEKFPEPNSQKVFLRYILPFGVRTAMSLVNCGSSGYSAFRGAYPENTAELEDLVSNALGKTIGASAVAKHRKAVEVSKTPHNPVVDPKWQPQMDDLGEDEDIPEEPVPEEPIPESRKFDSLIKSVLLSEDITGSVGGVPSTPAPTPTPAPSPTPHTGTEPPTDGGDSPMRVEMEEAKTKDINAEQTKQAFLWMRLVSKQERGNGYFENDQVVSQFLDEDKKEFKKYYDTMADNEMLCEYLAGRLGSDEELIIDALHQIGTDGYNAIMGGDPRRELLEVAKYGYFVSMQYFPVDGPLQRFKGAKKFSPYLYADPESNELYYALNTYPPGSSGWFQTPSVKPMIIMSDRTLPFGRRLGAFLGKSKPQTSQNAHGGRVIKGF